MHFKKLTIANLGPFRGRIDFDLGTDSEAKRPVILFGGKNGAGKTNILESLKLCLYGRAAFGRKLNEPDYQREIFKRLHKHPEVKDASVELLFSIVRNGSPTEFLVRRSWKLAGTEKYTEELSLLENGSLLHSILPEHWQEFIDEILPPTLSQLFFFDGERIQELASEDQSQAAEALSDAVKSLFGLSLIERLSADLTLIERDAGEAGSSDRAKQISLLHAELADARSASKAANDKLQALADRLERERRQRTRIEDQLRLRGGNYAKQREALSLAEQESKLKLQHLEGAFRKDSGEFFPFLFCQDLVRDLKDDIETYTTAESRRVAAQAFSENTSTLKNAFSSSSLTKLDRSLTTAQKTKLKSYVEGLLTKLGALGSKVDSARAIDVSRTDLSRIEGWIRTILNQAPKSAKKFSVEMELVTRQLLAARQELDKAPSEEDVRPLFDELKISSERLGTLLSEESALKDQARVLEIRVRDIEIKLEKLAKDAVRASDISVVFERSVAARDVVKRFGVALTKKKLDALAAEVLSTFNFLARKQNVVTHVQIDPTSYSLSLYTSVAGHMPKDRLSAGERQILAISILWALAKLSGRAMPMIIDTPLGRLDSEHRANLVHRYFTQASHQVIVLSTDEEVDERFYKDLSKHVSRTYHLSYDTNAGCTSVNDGYFWS